ncbi:TonB-dependent receptor [Novosphingobium sp.]|uniref:TonB-dependent receptor plug domain-containing protein n=1 Tax=Novosphingobium sp. TaxID=1874826 RepID=UPI00286E0670|nr:TonB-dependent receptor [Novosphingobium sp.]
MSLRLRTVPALLAGAAIAFSSQPGAARESTGTSAPVPSPDQDTTSEERSREEADIVVTGSRIRGAPIASEVTTLSRDTIVSAGQVDLGEAMRSLPQNFGGGQNPGIGTGAGLVNSNVNSASSVNLRGLGPDASLTLLNGHRLPYDGAFGGVDISAIPLAALDRIEVLPDGASALYGSDAVAGVVNVMLRRDYQGVTTSARLGASTDGGNFQQQADLVAGSKWSGGGFMVAYDFAHNSAIAAGQRSYAASLDPANSLYPAQRRHAAILSAHQDLGGGITASVDALFSRRDSETVGGTAAARYLFQPHVESMTLAPSLEVPLSGDWSIKVQGALGRDRTHYATTFTPAGGSASVTSGCFCNRSTSAEIGAEGPLFALAGGDARVAFGAGYRSNGMAYTRFVNGAASGSFDVSRRSHFAYGEINLPFVALENDLRGIDRLNLSAALRYEDYPGMAQLATPRLGLVYAPTSGLTLRGTWSRSFKAPTLYQQYVGYQTYLLPAAAFGVTPASGTVMYASGGNPDLKPERARSWTAGFDLHPASLPGLKLSATWFDIRYRDRVLQPIAGSIAAAFRDPGYASLLDFSPSVTELTGLIAGAQLGLQNFTGGAYNPAAVVALVDNRNINVAAQAIHGIDVQLGWNRELGEGRKLSFDLAGTWLESDQQLTSSLPEVQLAGTVFNPPKVRMRGSATYQTERLQVSGSLNYIGALADRRFATARRLNPSATIDLSARYKVLKGSGEEPAFAVSLSVTNLFNAKPKVIQTTGPTDTPYDSTNFSSVGRFIAVGISRHW